METTVVERNMPDDDDEMMSTLTVAQALGYHQADYYCRYYEFSQAKIICIKDQTRTNALT